jgi:hypothetical protein
MEGDERFNCYWNQSGPVIPDDAYSVLNYWRDVLFNMDLIGAYENGVAFGNLSLRAGQTSKFFIPGEATGAISILEPVHYIRIDGCNFNENALKCSGPLKGSSESLTHAVIYQADPGTNAIIHAHSIELWESLKGKVPSTDVQYLFGTPGMAGDIFRLFKETDVIEKRIIVTEGEKAGLLAFGNDMDEAINILMSYINKNK